MPDKEMWAGFEIDPVTKMRVQKRTLDPATLMRKFTRDPATNQLISQEDLLRSVNESLTAQPQGPPLPEDERSMYNAGLYSGPTPDMQQPQKKLSFFESPEFTAEIERAMADSGKVYQDEPFMANARQEEYDKKGKLIDMFANLTEAGQNFSRGMKVAGDFETGRESAPYEATALRDAAGRHREQLSPAERDYYASMGIETPEGLTRSQLKTSIPMIQQQQAMRAQEARLQSQASRDAATEEWRRANLEARNRGIDVGEERLEQQEALAKRPSERIADDLAALQRSTLELDEIEKRKDSYNTGPLSSALHTAGAAIGFGSADFGGFKARTQGVFNAVVKALAGSSVTGNELARARAAFPQVWDDDELFLSKLKEFREAAREGFEVLKKFHESRGSDMSKFNFESRTGAGPSGTIDVIGPNGEDGTVSADEDLSQYPGWKRK